MSSAALNPLVRRLPALTQVRPDANGWQPSHHINQIHPQGAGKDYVNGAYNCGPAVVAMLARGHGQLGHLNDAQLIQQLGHGIVTEEGTDGQGLARMLERASVPPAAEALGAGYEDAALKEHLRQGHQLIAQVRSYDPQTKQSSAHYVLVQGMTPRGNYIVSDPLANGPYIVSPRQLKEAVLKAPPDGGMLLPISSPAEARQATPAVATPSESRSPVLPAPGLAVSRGEDGFVGPEVIESKAFTATDDLFEGVDTRFRQTKGRPFDTRMERNERRNHFHVDVHYGRYGRKHEGKEAVVTPKRQSVEAFADHLLKLKERGNTSVYDMLARLESSTFEKDQQVLELVKQSDLEDGGIGKKMMGDCF